MKRKKVKLRSIISINGPQPGTESAETFPLRTLIEYEELKHYKVLTKPSLVSKPNTSGAVQTQCDKKMDESTYATLNILGQLNTKQLLR